MSNESEKFIVKVNYFTIIKKHRKYCKRDYQEEYYKAIEDSTAAESTPFIEFMLEMILKAILDAQKNDVPKNVPNARLENILEFIKENKNITIQELANKLNVTDKTIKRDIAKLKEQNKLKRVGSLKSGCWEIQGVVLDY